ncbi:hypothetical protein [Yersinia similis]|uniref:hypothetical protein n=1 Tax=Yersinia similis TaxID=367190 RepID=UPI0011A67762|nr:hypothetical protein [Yersinia similis]
MLSKEHLESLTRVWVETHLVNKMATELLSLREQLAELKALPPFAYAFHRDTGVMWFAQDKPMCSEFDVIPLFTAAKPIKTPVTLPPLIDVDNLSGHELDCAKFHNNAIAMCSIAIRQADYPSECSATFYPTDKQGGE